MINFPESYSGTVYEKPDYAYLEKYAIYLWQLYEKDILWEGQNGIVFNDPNKPNQVIKIAKPWEVDKLDEETKKHRKFFLLLKKLKLENNHWLNLEKFKIPKVEIYEDTTGIYRMEKIIWVNYKRVAVMDYYKDRLIDYSKEYLFWLWDRGFVELAKEIWFEEIPRSRTEEDANWHRQEYVNFVIDCEAYWTKLKRETIDPILRLFEQHWYKHGDTHWGNFLESKVKRNF